MTEDKINLLICGYIHEWNKDQINNKIPEDLIKQFIMFYPFKELKFNTNRIGWDIYFENNDKTVKISKLQFSHKLALLNEIFTDEMCQRFEIKYIVRISTDSVCTIFM